MGNCLRSSPKRETKALPIDESFEFPSPLPSWPQGGGFASGYIDLGGLQVCQISSFKKIWATYEGGPGNLGATFFEPSQIPEGFSMLGCYSQPNNQQLFGWVLVGKDNQTSDQESANPTLKKPIDYSLVWSSESLKISQDGCGYIWLPIPPDGYKALGHVVTITPEKPSLEKLQCVRIDLTDESQTANWIWGQGTRLSEEYGLDVYSLWPRIRGTQARGVSAGTFLAQTAENKETSITSLVCLKNNNFSTLSSMPNIRQIEALVQAYSPWIYFHPKEIYLPCSVNWFFVNGALLYEKGNQSSPVSIEATGSNLPQGGSNDGEYWLNLPSDENTKEKVKKGDLQNCEAYLHIKPMLGGTFTDIAIWIFYPFNGPSTAKLGLIDIPLGKIGEHVGDWEHLTLRISNFSGILEKVYFSEHSKGMWVDAPLLEYQNGNKPVAYASRNGHAFYPKSGLVLQGKNEIGIRNDTDKSNNFIDTGARYSVMAAGHLSPAIVEPTWLNYAREWGPRITYSIGEEVEKLENLLPSEQLKSSWHSVVDMLPKEIFGEEGPTGPKMKNSWDGDER